jgi:hypothetical protein
MADPPCAMRSAFNWFQPAAAFPLQHSCHAESHDLLVGSPEWRRLWRASCATVCQPQRFEAGGLEGTRVLYPDFGAKCLISGVSG